MSPHEIQIPGLELLGELGRGAQSVVYRAQRNGRQYAVKIPLTTPPDESEVRRHLREAATLALIRHPALPAIVDVGVVNGVPYTAMELAAGTPLSLELGVPLDERRVVTLARSLAGVLHEMHVQGLVHRDVKPANILITAAGSAALIDFGLVAHASTMPAQDPVGTLRYSAPEQVGTLRRPVDGRADLYALGCVLYECVTGQPPFMTVDVAELLRHHAAVVPRPVNELNPAASPGVAAIIERLLAKDPDDRYQSGAALALDLERLGEFAARHELATTMLLRTGQLPGPPVPLELVGRARELSELADAWHAVTNGSGQTVLVEGVPGSGKSRMMADFVARLPLVLVSRSVADDPLPYAAVRQLLDSLLTNLLEAQPGHARLDRVTLRTAAAVAGPLLRIIAPRLANAIGEYSSLPDLDDAEARLEEAIATFLLDLATAVGPLLLRVDDVQWLDQGSRKILERIAHGVRERPLMLLLAGRNDADSGPELAASVSELVHAAKRIELTPLNEEAIALLVRNYLGSRKVDPDVARLVLKLSDGLPLLALEIARALVDEGRLRPHWGHWQLDLDGSGLLELPVGAQRLVERRLARLATATRSVLRVAALGGARFDEELLAQVGGIDAAQVVAAIADAQRAHLVELAPDGRYKFVHTRIAEGLLSVIEPRERAAMHLEYARALDQRCSDSDDHVFALARHYALAGPDQRSVRMVETTLEAGLRALRSHAAAHAYELLEAAREAAQAIGHTPRVELWEALGEACLRTRRLEQAFEYYDVALSHAHDPLVWARIQARRAGELAASRSLLEATQVIGAALAALDVEVPRGDARSAVGTAVAWGRDRLLTAGVGTEGRERERTRLVARLYGALGRIAYLRGDLPLIVQIGMLAAEPARVLGETPEGAQALADHASMLSAIGATQLGRAAGLRAAEVAKRLGDPITIAHTRLAECYEHMFARDTPAFVTMTLARLDEFRRWLPTADVVNVHYTLAYTLVVQGRIREARSVTDDALAFLDRVGPRAAIVGRHPLFRLRCGVLLMLGEDQRARELLERCEAAATQASWDDTDVRATFGPMALIYLETQRHEALEALEARYRRLPNRLPRRPVSDRAGYACVALARLADAIRSQRAGRVHDLAPLRSAIESSDSGRRVPQQRALAVALHGALAWLEGKHDLAQKHLDEAERLGREHDDMLALFEAGRIRALVYAGLGRAGAARAEKVRAVALADSNGLHSRSRRLRLELPFDEWRKAHPSASDAASELSGARNPSAMLLGRHLDALLAVALASADQLDPVRQARMVLDHLVRVLDAERGFLFLRARGADSLELAAGRCSGGDDLDQTARYSRSVVERVRVSRSPYVHSSGLDGLRDASDSIVAGDLRSIIAAPLMLDDHFLGVIYLDNHLASGVFSEEDLSILSALSAHIAIAVETGRAAEERRLFEARLRQQQKLESIGTLAGGVAHEVNNPIQGIMSYAELIKRVAHEPDTVREFAGNITDECMRVATIVKNLLSMARTDEGKRTPENLFRIVHGSLSLFRVVLQKDQIQLDIEVPGDLPDMRCNGQQIQQVIMNLVTNARDAVNERYGGADTGKQIVVSATLVERDRQPTIRMTVQDNGTGIDPLLVDRIFDPFFTTKPQGQGTGLGLWICHRIVAEQGGNLSLESEVGQFTRFHVDLPVDE